MLDFEVVYFELLDFIDLMILAQISALARPGEEFEIPVVLKPLLSVSKMRRKNCRSGMFENFKIFWITFIILFTGLLSLKK